MKGDVFTNENLLGDKTNGFVGYKILCVTGKDS